MSEENPQDRRTFLRETVAVSAGVGCFATGLREALALAALQEKPLLNEQNLNKWIEAHHKDEKEYAAQLKEAEGNLVEFLRRHFTVTERQLEELKTLTPEDHRRLNQGLEHARGKHKKISVKIGKKGEVDNPLREGETVPVAFRRISITVEFNGGVSVSVSKS